MTGKERIRQTSEPLERDQILRGSWYPVAALIELGGTPDIEDIAELILNQDQAPPLVVRRYLHDLLTGKNGVGRPMQSPEDREWAQWRKAEALTAAIQRIRQSHHCSLRKACAHFDVRVDTAFEAVVDACADPSRDGAWITAEIRNAYVMLHRLGWAHSVEAWSLDDDQLAGGLYGVAIGGLFAGESMFHRRTDASKVALVGLVDILGSGGVPRLLDVQWRTEHLASLGVVDISRADYLERLAAALRLPLPEPFGG